jgi:hypothetical protein
MAPYKVHPLVHYIFGSGGCLLTASLLGACAYNSIWSNDNRWRSLHYGREAMLGSIAMAIAILSALAFVATVVGFVVIIFKPKSRPLQLMVWACGLLLTFIVIALEGASLEYTKYGSQRICTQWNYPSQDDFNDYVETYGSGPWADFVRRPIPLNINEHRDPTDSPVPTDVDLPDYLQYYSRSTVGTNYNNDNSITPVVINWTKLVVDGKLKGPNPCNYDIADSAGEATIGKWTASKFKDYWCHEYTRQVIDFEKWKSADDMGQVEIVKRQASYQRNRNALGSNSAFYRHNGYFIYVQVAGFVLVAVALFFSFIYELLCGKIEEVPEAAPQA